MQGQWKIVNFEEHLKQLLGTAIGAKPVPTYSSTFKTDFKGGGIGLTLYWRWGYLMIYFLYRNMEKIPSTNLCLSLTCIVFHYQIHWRLVKNRNAFLEDNAVLRNCKHRGSINCNSGIFL